MDTTGRSGLLVKYVMIQTNDPVSPVATLTVTMNVTPGPPQQGDQREPAGGTAPGLRAAGGEGGPD